MPTFTVNRSQNRFLKNKTSTIHAVLRQVLQDQPQIWGTIDRRLLSLAATDDLIARLDGSGCDIKDLLHSELGPYGHVRFDLNGDPLFLPTKLAVSLALIFHELATNAAKYGALSVPDGRVVIAAGPGEDGTALRLVWREQGGPSVAAPARQGFGTRLLGQLFEQHGGSVVMDWRAEGLVCRIEVPLDAADR